jgi:hypothetical protein
MTLAAGAESTSSFISKRLAANENYEGGFTIKRFVTPVTELM